MDTIKYVVGAGVDTPEDLEERCRVVEGKVRRDAREIAEVLKLDLPAFMERQAKERYTQAPPGFALDKEQLRAVKASVAAAGQQAVATIVPRLEDVELWLDPAISVPPVAERRDLAAHGKASKIIQEAGKLLREALAKHGFPGLEGADFTYKLPTWFISGRLLVSIVESYWRNLDELRTLQQGLQAMREQTSRSARADEWDDA